MWNNWKHDGVPPSETADYLCLNSGHNDLAERLAEYLMTAFDFKVDVVSTFLVNN